MAQHIDIGDRLTAISEHHRHINQHLATVVSWRERAARQSLADLTRQAGTVGQQTQTNTARMRHHAGAVTSYQ